MHTAPDQARGCWGVSATPEFQANESVPGSPLWVWCTQRSTPYAVHRQATCTQNSMQCECCTPRLAPADSASQRVSQWSQYESTPRTARTPRTPRTTAPNGRGQQLHLTHESDDADMPCAFRRARFRFAMVSDMLPVAEAVYAKLRRRPRLVLCTRFKHVPSPEFCASRSL